MVKLRWRDLDFAPNIDACMIFDICSLLAIRNDKRIKQSETSFQLHQDVRESANNSWSNTNSVYNEQYVESNSRGLNHTDFGSKLSPALAILYKAVLRGDGRRM